jgi:hypothetical protein
MAQYETPHWTGPPPRPERDVRSEIADWFAKYAFYFLLLFFIGLVVAAFTFLPSLRGGSDELSSIAGAELGSANSPIAGFDASKEGATLLNISTSPSGAVVQIDVDSIGVTPLYKTPVDRKVHLLSIVKPGFVRIDTVLFADDFQKDTTSFFFVLKRSDAVVSDILSSPEAEPVTPAPDRATAQTGDASTNRNPVATPPSQPDNTASTDPVVRSEGPVSQVGSLSVSSVPAGASVLVEGRFVGITPLVMSGLDPGQRQIELMLDGYRTEKSFVAIRAGVRSEVETVLSISSGTLVVLAKPYGTIYIDGQLAKRDLDIEYRTSLPAGQHVVSVSHPFLGQLTQSVTIDDTETNLVFDFNTMKIVSK